MVLVPAVFFMWGGGSSVCEKEEKVHSEATDGASECSENGNIFRARADPSASFSPSAGPPSLLFLPLRLPGFASSVLA